MTLYANFRAQEIGGGVIDPMLLTGDGQAVPPALTKAPQPAVAGKNILFAVHGFNVNRTCGANSLGQLETYLKASGVLGDQDLFVGVLWPGDFWIPVIDYPFEGDVAIQAGKKLATLCNKQFAAAQSLSFASHSLGARVVLEALCHLDRPARSTCLTAAAINRDCLETQYQRAAANSDSIALLASHEDLVLKLAFAVGDPIADLLDPDHRAFEAALGAGGPPTPASAPILSPWQIPDTAQYGHGDYFPPGDAPPAAAPKWPAAADFIGDAFLGRARLLPG